MVVEGVSVWAGLVVVEGVFVWAGLVRLASFTSGSENKYRTRSMNDFAASRIKLIIFYSQIKMSIYSKVSNASVPVHVIPHSVMLRRKQ